MVLTILCVIGCDMKINEKQLKELLGLAYEAGWHGSKDLKDSAVQQLFEEWSFSTPLEEVPGHSWVSQEEVRNDAFYRIDNDNSFYNASNNELSNQMQWMYHTDDV